MRILYVGDVTGDAGRALMARELPGIKQEYKVDFTIVQAENVSGGKGITVPHLRELQRLGVDALSGGNWTFQHKEIYPLLEDPSEPITRPANYPPPQPGKLYKFVDSLKGPVLIISLLGQTVGRDANLPIKNPLYVVDEILKETEQDHKVATIVNFHGDFSSEKIVIGQYLDGRVSAVIGDHWHIPTADAQVLPGGTAHISDVGMVGTRRSSLGVKSSVVIDRWLSGKPSRNEWEASGPFQFCAVLIEVNIKTGQAKSIEQIVKYSD